MSDIDFDELDRAVNSLMEQRGEKIVAKDKATTSDTTPSPAPDPGAASSLTPPLSGSAASTDAPASTVDHSTTAANTEPAADVPSAADEQSETTERVSTPQPAATPEPMTMAEHTSSDAAVSSFPTEAPSAETSTPPAAPELVGMTPVDGSSHQETSSPETALEESVPSPTISKKPTGRFMDVVHPSSDMKSQRPMAAPRTTATIQPLGSGHAPADIVTGGQQPTQTVDQGAASEDASLTDKVTASLHGDEALRKRPSRLVIEPDPTHVAEGLTEENLALDVKDLPDYESIAGEAEGATDSEFVEEGLKLDDFSVESFDEAAFAAEMGETVSDNKGDDANREAVGVEATPVVAEAEAETETEAAALQSTPENDEVAPDVKGDETAVQDAVIADASPHTDEAATDKGESSASPAPEETDPAVSTAPKHTLEPELDAELLAIEAAELVSPLPPETDDAKKTESDTRSDTSQQYQAADDIAPQPEPMFDAAATQPAAEELKHKEKKSSGWGVFFLIILCALVGVAGGVAAHFLLLQ